MIWFFRVFFKNIYNISHDHNAKTWLLAEFQYQYGLTNYLDKNVTGICVASKQAITKEAEQTWRHNMVLVPLWITHWFFPLRCTFMWYNLYIQFVSIWRRNSIIGRINHVWEIICSNRETSLKRNNHGCNTCILI
jgi:hypothetical protein